MIKLKTPRLIVRDPRESDFPGWHRLMSDKKTMFYIQDIMTHSEAESRKNLEDAIAEAKNTDRKKYFLVIELAETGEYAGQLGYTVEDITPSGKIVHAGYFMLSEFQGKGYMTEAFSALICFAFEHEGVYRINTGCFSENIASERVMQKCGMIKEGDFKCRAWLDGKMRDRLQYRLLREEWSMGENIL